MNMLEMQSSLSGMSNAFEAQKNAVDLMHKSLAAAETTVKPAQALSEQGSSVLDARAVIGQGKMLNLSV